MAKSREKLKKDEKNIDNKKDTRQTVHLTGALHH